MIRAIKSCLFAFAGKGTDAFDRIALRSITLSALRFESMKGSVCLSV